MLTFPIIDRLCQEAAPKVRLESKRCLRSRFNKNRCVRCLEACPRGAVGLKGNQITLDPEKCTDCRQCTAVCPNDAFRDDVDHLSILKGLTTKPFVLVSCPKGVLNHERITIPCIGIFSEAMLAAMNMVTQQQCYVDTSQCARCLNSHCLPAFEKKMAAVAARLQDRNSFRLTYHADGRSPLPVIEKNERRSFFRIFQKNFLELGREAASRTAPDHPPVTAPPLIAKKTPEDISVLLHALVAAPPERAMEKTAISSYFFSVSADDKCDLCPLCTGMCPTGALQREKSEGKISLTFTSARCSGCGLCTSFCRKNALALTRGVAGDPHVARHLATK